jgi:hypothetical protein
VSHSRLAPARAKKKPARRPDRGTVEELVQLRNTTTETISPIVSLPESCYYFVIVIARCAYASSARGKVRKGASGPQGGQEKSAWVGNSRSH